MAELDLADLHTEEWSHRFVIVVEESVENSVLFMYGSNVARLLNLSSDRMPYVPLGRQLPEQFADVFLRGCKECIAEDEPIRLDGETNCGDGTQAQYRSVFMPLGEGDGPLKRVAFGAINARMTEPMTH